MTGDVREGASDWVAPGHAGFAARRSGEPAGTFCAPRDPRTVGEADARGPGETIPRQVIKGGSHPRPPSYCLRYQPARQSEAIVSSTSRIGFRCILRR